MATVIGTGPGDWTATKAGGRPTGHLLIAHSPTRQVWPRSGIPTAGRS
jgi:hypothetical protein